jgi:hypothetical protein
MTMDPGTMCPRTKSLICSAPGAMCPLDNTSLARCIPWSSCPMKDAPLDVASQTDMSRPWITSREGLPMLPDLAGAAQLRASSNSSCWYTTHSSLGMTLISSNTLAFGLIGIDRTHGTITICFGNMNVVFGSNVALLVFWAHMFRILVTV